MPFFQTRAYPQQNRNGLRVNPFSTTQGSHHCQPRVPFEHCKWAGGGLCNQNWPAACAFRTKCITNSSVIHTKFIGAWRVSTSVESCGESGKSPRRRESHKRLQIHYPNIREVGGIQLP